MTLVVFLAALIGGMLIGLPICFALLFSGVCMMLYLNGFNAQILSQNLFSGADSFSMMAVPFFIMAGEFMNRGGITKRIVNAANAIIGHVRGGLGYVAIMAILLFASMIGSAVASTAFLGAILIPMMVRAGYKRDTCTGLIAAGNILSPDHAAFCANDHFWRTGGGFLSQNYLWAVLHRQCICLGLCVYYGSLLRKKIILQRQRDSQQNRLQKHCSMDSGH